MNGQRDEEGGQKTFPQERVEVRSRQNCRATTHGLHQRGSGEGLEFDSNRRESQKTDEIYRKNRRPKKLAAGRRWGDLKSWYRLRRLEDVLGKTGAGGKWERRGEQTAGRHLPLKNFAERGAKKIVEEGEDSSAKKRKGSET